jgi:hypothetical protein
VVEEVVELGAELELHALDGSVEFLVEVEVGFVEGRGAAGVAGGVAEGAEDVAGCVLGRRQDEGGVVDVVDVAGVGGAVGAPWVTFWPGTTLGRYSLAPR